MASHEFPNTDEAYPDEYLRGLEEYGLSEEQHAALPEEARVALAIAAADADREPLEAGELTSYLATATRLDEDTVRKSNRTLLQRGYLHREDLKPGQALKLALNEEGVRFLTEETKKVKKASPSVNGSSEVLD